MSVKNVLSDKGSVSINFWGGDLGFVNIYVQETGGNAGGLPQADDGTEVQVAEGQELEKRGSGKGTQIIRNPYTGGVH